MIHFSHLCLALLWNMTIQATVLLALAALVMACSRRLSASFRHYVWVSCLLALPFLVVPGFFMPARPVAVSLVRTMPLPAVPVPAPALSAAKDATPAPLTVPSAAPFPTRPWLPSPTHHSAALPDWRLFLCLAWLAGVFAYLCRLAAGLYGTCALMRASMPIADGPLADTAAVLYLDTGRVAVRQALSPETVVVPMTWGVVRPVILFPADADTWPHDRLRAALLHETAHVRRCDWLTQTLIQCVSAVLWFHPFVWLAARACRAESERACDDFVLASGMAAPDYARHLLDVARAASGRRMTGAVAMAQTARIETRLKDILAPKRDRRPLTRRLWLGAFTVSLVMIASVGAFVQVTGLSAEAAPAVPNSGPETVAAGDAPQTVTLTNGVRVRLLGITGDRVPRDRWWKSDGTPTAPLQIRQAFPAALPTGTQRRVFAVQYDYDGDSQPTVAWAGTPNWGEQFEVADKARGLYYPVPATTWAFDPDNHRGSTLGGSDFHQGARIASLYYLYQTFSPSQQTCNVRFGIAAGAPKTVICKAAPGKTIVSDPSGPVIFTLVPNPHHLMDPRAIERGQDVLQVTDYFQEADAEKAGKFLSVQDHDRDILALDRAGRAVYDIRGSQVDSGGDGGKIKHEQLCHFPASILPRIDRFELIDRPFQWASFSNVRLEPKPVSSSINTSSVTKTSTHLSMTFKPTHGSATTIESTGLRHGPNGAWTFTNATLTRPDGSRVHAKSMTLKLKDLMTRALKEQPKVAPTRLEVSGANAAATNPINVAPRAVSNPVPAAPPAKDKTPIGPTTTVTTQGPNFTFHTDSTKNKTLTNVTITTTGPTTTTYHSDGSVASTTTRGGAVTTIHCGAMRRGPNGSWVLSDVTITRPGVIQTHAKSMTIRGSDKKSLFDGDVSKIEASAASNAPEPR